MIDASRADQSEEARALAAIQAGDEAAFGSLLASYRRQLHVHCYRLLGSFDEAEDLVQETLLRAWRGRDGFQARSSLRTWLYRIATNACLNALQRAPRRVLPQDVAPPVTATFDAGEARGEPPWAPELPWLQPYPDRLLDAPAPGDAAPDAVVVSRETIQLAYLAALQHLVPRQRAILVLRDVLGWSAREVADLLDLTVVSVNSALQRARTGLRAALPAGREEWTATSPRSAEEGEALQQFMRAWERSDTTALTSLLREDARWAMPPAPLWFQGRTAIIRLFELFPLSASGDFRLMATAANRQPAVISYQRPPGESTYRFSGVTVLGIEHGQIVDIVAFSAALCGHWGVPPTV